MILILKLVLFILTSYFCYMVTAVPTEETVWKNPYNFSTQDHKQLDAIFERCTGSCNNKYCTIFSSCRPFNRTSKMKRLDIYLHDGVKLEAPILIEINAFKKFRTQYRPHMLTYKDELCKILLDKVHPFFVFFGIAKRTGNLYDPCPMSGHRYEVPKLTTTWIGTLVPTGEWKIDFIVTKVIDGTEEQILTVTYYFLVKAKGALDEF